MESTDHPRPETANETRPAPPDQQAAQTTNPPAEDQAGRTAAMEKTADTGGIVGPSGDVADSTPGVHVRHGALNFTCSGLHSMILPIILPQAPTLMTVAVISSSCGWFCEKARTA